MPSPASTPTRRVTRALSRKLGDSPQLNSSSLKPSSSTPPPAAAAAAASSLRTGVIVFDSGSDSDSSSAIVVVKNEPEEKEEDIVEVAAAAAEESADKDEQRRVADVESSDDDSDSGDDDSSSSGSDEVESSSSSDEDEPAVEDQDALLDSLLSQAYIEADSQESTKAARLAGEEVVLQLEKKEKPLPALSVPRMPDAYFSFLKDGRVAHGAVPPPSAAASSSIPAASTSNAVASSSKLTPELDNVTLPAHLSKKAAKAAHKASAGLGWAELPPIPDDRRKEMTKEYHALRLRNALDPKRHYKGQGSSKVVPEVFAIGKLYETSKKLTTSTLAPSAAARPGSIISEIMGDSSSKAYAKRKFGDLQSQRERNGRKKVVKKSRH